MSLVETEEWVISGDGEYYQDIGEGTTKHDAIAAGIQEYRDAQKGLAGTYDIFSTYDELPPQSEATFYVGVKTAFIPYVDADRVIEYIQDQASYECGEYADDYLAAVMLEEEHRLSEMLSEAFIEWAKQTKNEPYFWVVSHGEEIRVSDYEAVDE